LDSGLENRKMRAASAAAETRSFAATPAAVTEMDDWIGTVGERWNLDARCLYRARVCVAELAANVLEHGGVAPEAGRIGIELRRISAGVEIEVTAPGVPFDSATAPLSDDADRIGGRGLRLVRAYSSAIAYHRLTDRNIVTLRVSGAA
jgi:anti-sigma regulatory factor (Ser/Thr protein kinase)